ncbi:hypothetical protein CY34DRAFT_700645 [Suillus luteus UH-Slu-Lm8-n1]|uniref:Uncharacterized protein n=1 Tax=Suillus luteus UH-Slu-Lm8-n1 TaxID=930992 RepID=A0A0D0AH36_9AGAM|nr:hypothetical protein CY34DRAFT_700645 [Suillus luteus UH-Slu-Lm8-n1]
MLWFSSSSCGLALKAIFTKTWLLNLYVAMPLHKLDPQGHPNYLIIRNTDLTELHLPLLASPIPPHTYSRTSSEHHGQIFKCCSLLSIRAFDPFYSQ